MMWLSRIGMRRGGAAGAVRKVVLEGGGDPGHSLVWTLFHNAPNGRDFLWRQEAPGVWTTLSEREPVDELGLFEVSGPKAFAPALESGDPLWFVLRANPAARITNGRAGRHLAKPLEWLDGKARACGFSLVPDRVWARSRRRREVPRRNGAPAVFTTVDFEGVLRVEDPEVFVPALSAGFGPAKAWGCGLMLIRRP